VIATQPADGTAGARRRQPARLAVLVAVLLGLFLMHGGPASAEAGCHGTITGTEMHMPAETGTGADTGAHHSGHAAQAAALGHAQGTGDKAVAQPDSSMRGAQCVATTPRSELPMPPLSAVALVLPAAVLLPGARRTYDGTRRRGPPPGGRRILLQVCVART
jgi:hypothetical protein